VPDQVGVVIPCHSEKRWPYLSAAVSSVLVQRPRPVEVVVVVDHNEALYQRASRELTGVTVLRNSCPEPGASGSRNTGAFHLDTPLIALLDDDASARPGWLAGLLAPFDDPEVCGTGGAVAPVWEARRPGWVPDEFLWAWCASFTGMPTTTSRVRNVWSVSMAVRRGVFEKVDGFRVGFGKVGDRSRPEDTDLCLRMSEVGGGHWMYVPDAVIDHQVPVNRTSYGYFLARCYHEGRGKVEMARLNRGRESLGSESEYLRRTLPAGVWRGLRDTARGRGLGGTARAATIVVGAAAAAYGGLVESLRRRPASAPPAAAIKAGT
jgi:glucosyl-dolichyl phosphate glucuronosyltransferase